MPPELRQPNTWLYYGLILLAVALLGVTTWQSIRTSADLRGAIERVSHSNDVLRRLNEVHAAVADMEAYARAYVLTRRSAWALQKASEAIERLERSSADLAMRVSDNTDQRERAERIAGAARERIALTVEGMQGFARGQFDIGQIGNRLERHNQLSQQIRATVAEMVGVEEALRERRWRAMDRRLEETRGITVIANSLALASGLLGLFLMQRSQYAWRRHQLSEMEARRARAASAEKSAFLASMSHEIRTPMNAIFGFSQLLANAVRGPREQQYVNSIMSSGKALLALINDILDLSKIEAGKLQLTPVPTDVRELVQDILGMFSQMAEEKRLNLRADVAAAVPATLELDGGRLRQILINLVGNAIKYTDEGGVLLRVYCGESDAGGGAVALHLSVEDTGLGIAPAQREQIFQPFVQGVGDGGARDGSGLGLSIVRRLVDLMGGHVTLQSEVGRGSVFDVELPRVPISELAPTPAQEAAIEFDRLRPSRILVVDDVAWNRDLMLAYFRGTRHQVLTAVDGEEAVALARSQRPDVILMDIRMPRLDGRKARERIRAEAALNAVRIIAVTASSLSGEESELREQFDGYVRKPFSQQELFEALARLLPLDEAAAGAPSAGLPLPPLPAAPDQDARERALARLAQLRHDTWPGLRDSLAIRGSAGFAAELLEIGRALGDAALVERAQQLRRAVDRFDLTMLEQLLREFPDVVAPTPQDPA